MLHLTASRSRGNHKRLKALEAQSAQTELVPESQLAALERAKPDKEGARRVSRAGTSGNSLEADH
jgi:hypothetical protein